MVGSIVSQVFYPLDSLLLESALTGDVVDNEGSACISIVDLVHGPEPLTAGRVPQLYFDLVRHAWNAHHLLHESGVDGGFGVLGEVSLHVASEDG